MSREHSRQHEDRRDGGTRIHRTRPSRADLPEPVAFGALRRPPLARP